MSTEMMMFLMGIFVLAGWYLDRHHREQGFLFYRRPLLATKGTFGSAPNPENVIQGYVWKDYRDVKKEFKKDDENIVYLDNFRFYDHFIEKAKVPRGTRKRIEKNTEIWLKPKDLTQGVCILGATGTGKSEMYYSLLNQKWYNRALIYDTKQDFIKFYYRKNIDIIYNAGLDERSLIWNFLDEHPTVQEAFFSNLLSSMLGEKKDYFSQAAQKRYSDTTKAIYSIYANKSIEKKWTFFITAIKDLISSMQNGESKSDSDVSKTMEQILEIFELSAYFIIKKQRKTFKIDDFFERKKGAKLYLANVEAYNSALKPIYTGFISAFTMVHATRDSYAAKNGDMTAYILDEYLGMMNYLDDDTIDRIHLKLRSYGCCPISGIQKLPKKKEHVDTLLAANYLLLIFGTAGNDIIKELKEKIGQTEYWYEDENTSTSGGKKTTSTSKQQKSMSLFSNDMIHGIGEVYKHVSYYPLKKTLYMGYTAQAKVRQRAKALIKADTKEFYKMKYKDFQVRETENFEEIFDFKPMSKLDEYKMFKKFEEAKKRGEDAIKSFKKENKLEVVNLEFLFKKFMEDRQVISNKMKVLTVDERFELSKKYEELKGNDEKELAFIEEHDLFGALPGLFDFRDNAEIIEDEW